MPMHFRLAVEPGALAHLVAAGDLASRCCCAGRPTDDCGLAPAAHEPHRLRAGGGSPVALQRAACRVPSSWRRHSADGSISSPGLAPCP